jgi:hypothetical protein
LIWLIHVSLRMTASEQTCTTRVRKAVFDESALPNGVVQMMLQSRMTPDLLNVLFANHDGSRICVYMVRVAPESASGPSSTYASVAKVDSMLQASFKSHPTSTKKHGYWLLFIAFLLLVFLHILSWVISQYRVTVTFDVHASLHIHTQGCEPSRAEEDEKPSH